MQLTGAGAAWTNWWSARQHDLGIDPANGWSASLVSLAVATALTALIVVSRKAAPTTVGSLPGSKR